MIAAHGVAEAVIARRAAAAVTAVTAGPGRAGRSAHTARAWIEALSARAQIRAERHTRRP